MKREMNVGYPHETEPEATERDMARAIQEYQYWYGEVKRGVWGAGAEVRAALRRIRMLNTGPCQ